MSLDGGFEKKNSFYIGEKRPLGIWTSIKMDKGSLDENH